jgi:hypothetical protein
MFSPVEASVLSESPGEIHPTPQSPQELIRIVVPCLIRSSSGGESTPLSLVHINYLMTATMMIF